MFKEIFRFQLQSSLKRPMVYLFTLINFILVFMASVSDSVIIGGSNAAVKVNSPDVIMTTTLLMTLVGVFMTTALVNSAMLKDFEHKFGALIFSTSIKKLGYLGGRFLSAYLLSLIPFTGVLLGLLVAGMVGLVDPQNVGPIVLSHYIQTFLSVVVPNIFIISSIIFILAALFKSSKYSFIGAILLLVLYVFTQSFIGSLDNEAMAVLLDPLGMSSYDILTKYWTIEERNTQLLSMSGLWFINRLIWMGAALLILVITYFSFSFSQKSKKIKLKNIEAANENPSIFRKMKALPIVKSSDRLATHWSLFLHQAWMETKGILLSTPFIVITVFSLVNMTGSISSVSERYGTGNHPVTYLMVDAIKESLYIFLVAVLMYYAGALIWKERENKMNELVDASPFPSWVAYLSKMAALFGIVIFTLCMGIACGMVAQISQGYTNFELGIYLKEFLFYDLIRFGGIIALAMFVQTIVNNKYLGYFAFLVLLIGLNFGPQALEITSNMVSYGNIPSYIYSDMNAWSLYGASLTLFSTYWALFAAILTTIGITFWSRGFDQAWGKRLQFAKARFSGKLSMVTLGLGLVWMTTTGFLFYQTQLVNSEMSDQESSRIQVSYEELYKQYEHIPQPRITAADYKIDIFPNGRSFTSNAVVTIMNKTDVDINDVHFNLPEDYNISISIKDAVQSLIDEKHDYQIFTLGKALRPGQEINFEVTSSYAAEGIENEVSNITVVQNGTFLSNFRFMPVIGYAPSRELEDPRERADNNLPFRASQTKLHSNCSASCQNSYISQDSDWVNVKSTISTTSDQIAIAPGSLIKTWEDGNRKYFEYKLEEKVLNFYSFISGKYEVARDVWVSEKGEEVDVEVYYHKGHEYNVDKMISSLKNSLTYFTNHFGAYPHKQARIIEFPRYDSFAQAFPGTMPYSESMGFIANLEEENAIDMVYYTVAHEMAHQWWAHKVIGANVQGATMLSESFAQYSALMVMKEEYGNDKMKQFMRYEMDRYLRGRSNEENRELPLMFTENQAYIHYRKGSVVMYALQDYIGEDNLNGAMRQFAEATEYQEPPYTNTLEFVDYLKAATPDSLSYMIHDMVESITLFSNKTLDAKYKTLPNGKYEVTLDVQVEKFSADSLGKETVIAHDDYIDIGVFSAEIPEGERYGRPILVKRVKITEKLNTFTLVVDEKPATAGIDPNFLLVDRMPEDNVKELDFVK